MSSNRGIDITSAADMIAELRDENAKLTAERNMWKANHDNQIELKRIICDRPDMGDRAKRVAALISERDQLAQAVADAEVALECVIIPTGSPLKSLEAFHRFRNRGKAPTP